MRRARQIILGGVLASLALSACSAAAVNPPADTTAETVSASTSIAPVDTEPEPVARPDSCDNSGGMPWTADESVNLDVIGEAGDLSVYAAEYPLPGPTEGLWSQWGQGIALGDGRHLSAVGDHLGVDGNSWFFLYDGEERSLTRIFDVLSVVPHNDGAWGYGKIHAQMVVNECSSVWAATYWGTRNDIVYGNGYEGDRLLEIDPTAATVTDRGPLAEGRGIPTLAISADGYTLVAAAVDPGSDTAVVASYDTRANAVLAQLDDPRQVGYRALAAHQSGTVLFSIGGGHLAEFDPESQTATDANTAMPGDWLRAATDFFEGGASYGVTEDDPRLFALSADGTANTLGDPRGYTTSLAATDDGERLFWLPDAHGSAWQTGATVRAIDTETGEVSELISLAPLLENEFGLRAGGTYSIVYDQGKLILGVNASPLDDDSGFGTVVLVVIEGL